MRPKELIKFLEFAMRNGENVLVKSGPGMGKTAIIKQAARNAGMKVVMSHPAISDPTDYKGLPFVMNGEANFHPYGNLKQLIHATEPTVCFTDDIGQAPAAVQAALMQVIHEKQIGEHKVSDFVMFIGATNRKGDQAGVSGLLEPVKSRYSTIVELEVSVDDWTEWALDNNMPLDLITFLHFRPTLLNDFKPTKDIINSPCPRTVAAVGRLQNKGLFSYLNFKGEGKEEWKEHKDMESMPQGYEYEVIKGAVGEGFAAEYVGYLKLKHELPPLEDIVADPERTKVPGLAAAKYALVGALAANMRKHNVEALLRYIPRMGDEFMVATMKMMSTLHQSSKNGEFREVIQSTAFADWAYKHGSKITNR